MTTKRTAAPRRVVTSTNTPMPRVKHVSAGKPSTVGESKLVRPSSYAPRPDGTWDPAFVPPKRGR